MAELNKYQIEKNQEIGRIAKELVDASNSMSANPAELGKVFCEAIKHNHRTLQQATIGILLNAIICYADLEYWDGRNEYAVQVCKEVKEALKERLFKNELHTPLI